MNTKLLFTWESQYQVLEALAFRKDNFVNKFGKEWVHIFRHDELDLWHIQSALMGGWFFSSKSLVVIYGIPRDNITTNKAKAEQAEPIETLLQDHREQIPEDNILILISYKPDKRTKSWKFFSKSSEIKEFKPKKWKDLTLFVLSKLVHPADTTKALVSNSQAETIVRLVGTNLYNLSHEAEKLLLYAQYHSLDQLTDKHIHSVVYQQWEGDNFKILDNIITNPQKALTLIDQARDDGTKPPMFIGMLFRWLKLILWMIELDAEWVWSKDIAKILKYHPFAVSKQYSKIATLREKKSQIESFYLLLLQLDRDVKSGRYPMDALRVRIKGLVHGFK